MNYICKKNKKKFKSLFFEKWKTGTMNYQYKAKTKPVSYAVAHRTKIKTATTAWQIDPGNIAANQIKNVLWWSWWEM